MHGKNWSDSFSHDSQIMISPWKVENSNNCFCRIFNYLTLSLDEPLSTRIPALKSSDSFFYGNSSANWTGNDTDIRINFNRFSTIF